MSDRLPKAAATTPDTPRYPTRPAWVILCPLKNYSSSLQQKKTEVQLVKSLVQSPNICLSFNHHLYFHSRNLKFGREIVPFNLVFLFARPPLTFLVHKTFMRCELSLINKRNEDRSYSLTTSNV